MSPYRFINAERGHYPMWRLCPVLGGAAQPVSAAGERRVGLSMQGHRARRGLARGGHHAGIIGHHGLAAGFFAQLPTPSLLVHSDQGRTR